MAAKANQRKWLSMVSPLLMMLSVPWFGFWNSDHSLAAIGYCAANFLLLPLVLVVLIGVEQAIFFATARALGDV